MSLINVVRAAFEKKQAAAAAEAAAGAHDYSSARCTQPPARPSDGVVCGAGGCACLGRPAGNPPLDWTGMLPRLGLAKSLRFSVRRWVRQCEVSGVQPLTQANKELLMFNPADDLRAGPRRSSRTGQRQCARRAAICQDTPPSWAALLPPLAPHRRAATASRTGRRGCCSASAPLGRARDPAPGLRSEQDGSLVPAVAAPLGGVVSPMRWCDKECQGPLFSRAAGSPRLGKGGSAVCSAPDCFGVQLETLMKVLWGFRAASAWGGWSRKQTSDVFTDAPCRLAVCSVLGSCEYCPLSICSCLSCVAAVALIVFPVRIN